MLQHKLYRVEQREEKINKQQYNDNNNNNCNIIDKQKLGINKIYINKIFNKILTGGKIAFYTQGKRAEYKISRDL